MYLQTPQDWTQNSLKKAALCEAEDAKTTGMSMETMRKYKNYPMPIPRFRNVEQNVRTWLWVLPNAMAIEITEALKEFNEIYREEERDTVRTISLEPNYNSEEFILIEHIPLKRTIMGKKTHKETNTQGNEHTGKQTHRETNTKGNQKNNKEQGPSSKKSKGEKEETKEGEKGMGETRDTKYKTAEQNLIPMTEKEGKKQKQLSADVELAIRTHFHKRLETVAVGRYNVLAKIKSGNRNTIASDLWKFDGYGTRTMSGQRIMGSYKDPAKPPELYAVTSHHVTIEEIWQEATKYGDTMDVSQTGATASTRTYTVVFTTNTGCERATGMKMVAPKIHFTTGHNSVDAETKVRVCKEMSCQCTGTKECKAVRTSKGGTHTLEKYIAVATTNTSMEITMPPPEGAENPIWEETDVEMGSDTHTESQENLNINQVVSQIGGLTIGHPPNKKVKLSGGDSKNK